MISTWPESSNYRSTRIIILNIQLIGFYSRVLINTGAFIAGCVP